MTHAFNFTILLKLILIKGFFMKNILFKFGLILCVNAICIPLAYMGVAHGSSYGLEAGIFMVILCIAGNTAIVKGK